MKNITKFLIYLLIIIILIGILGLSIYLKNRQAKLKECRELCKYHTERGANEVFTYSYATGAFWAYSNNKNFETQSQCLEYCLDQE